MGHSSSETVPYRLGNVDGIKFRIPEALVLSTVTSDPDSAWKPSKPEPNAFSRPIRYFDLKLLNILPGSNARSLYEASLNTRGFVEVSAYAADGKHLPKSAREVVQPYLEGRNAAGAYKKRSDVAGFQHWSAQSPPPGTTLDTHLFVDEENFVVVRCSGKDDFNIRYRSVCEAEFPLPQYHLNVEVSFSGADLKDARDIKRHVSEVIASFVVL